MDCTAGSHVRRRSDWMPILPDSEGALHERLAQSIADAIESGELSPHDPLPAHRHLAEALGLSLGTVTRAYDALRKQGLTASQPGRGTFVAPTHSRHPASLLDLSVNLPPAAIGEAELSRILDLTVSRARPDILSRYGPVEGLYEHRQLIGEALIGETITDKTVERLLVTNGAQHAMFLAFAALPPGPLAMEQLTFPGALRAAATLRRPVISLPMDDEGVLPEALAEAASSDTAPVAAYIMPTVQNPTGATMGVKRRETLAELAISTGTMLIEDQVYNHFGDEDLPTLAELAPGHTFAVNSVSKSFSPGLRVGYLLSPSTSISACYAALQGTQSMASTLSTLAFVSAYQDGLFQRVRGEIQQESRRRNQLAFDLLGDRIGGSPGGASHVWLPMPSPDVRDVVLAAARRQVTLCPAEAFLTDRHAMHSGVRICLGTLPLADLTRALEILKTLLDQGGEALRGFAPAV